MKAPHELRAMKLFQQKYSAKAQRVVCTIETKGFTHYIQNYSYKMLNKRFLLKMNHKPIREETWRRLNFEALDLKGSAEILLNPSDEGFSKQFHVYGFREPLNTFAIFSYIAKNKPVVLDIGANLGYFSLVELQAGAQKVVAVEPVHSSFHLLSRTLDGFKHVELLNIAVSDEDHLTLYVATNRNVTSSSKLLLASTGQEIAEEIQVQARTLESLAAQYGVSMVRMDIEGHEYRILNRKIPDYIKCISLELHVLPPYEKSDAVKLLHNLRSQNFKTSVLINEMNYGYYQMVQRFGLKTAYKLATCVNGRAYSRPNIQTNPSADELVKSLPEKGQVHLLLER